MSTYMKDLKALKEITNWDDVGYKVPNHTYILNEHGQCVGFKATGTKKYTQFKLIQQEWFQFAPNKRASDRSH